MLDKYLARSKLNKLGGSAKKKANGKRVLESEASASDDASGSSSSDDEALVVQQAKQVNHVAKKQKSQGVFFRCACLRPS